MGRRLRQARASRDRLVADAAHWPWTLLLGLAVVKTLATFLTLAGGGSGGVQASGSSGTGQVRR